MASDVDNSSNYLSNISILFQQYPKLEIYLNELNNQIIHIPVNHNVTIGMYYKKLQQISQAARNMPTNHPEARYVQLKRAATFYVNTVAKHRQAQRDMLEDKAKAQKTVSECIDLATKCKEQIVRKWIEKYAKNETEAPLKMSQVDENVYHTQKQAMKHASRQTLDSEEQMKQATDQKDQSQMETYKKEPKQQQIARLQDSMELSKPVPLHDTLQPSSQLNSKVLNHEDGLSKAPIGLYDSTLKRLEALGIFSRTDETDADDNHRQQSNADALCLNDRLLALGIENLDHEIQQDSDSKSNLNEPRNEACETMSTDGNSELSSLLPINLLPPKQNADMEREQKSNSCLQSLSGDMMEATVVDYPLVQDSNFTNVANEHDSTSPSKNIFPGYPQPKNSKVLRQMIVPWTAIHDFETIANENTRLSFETCAILAGRLVFDSYRVTHLIVPKQHGSAHTCNMICEESLIEVLQRHNLMQLGWIHTHPTQDCFLSSIDQHTQHAYQRMLPESIAIVLAPKASPDFGCFRITDEGSNILSHCNLDDFHEHSLPSQQIFSTALSVHFDKSQEHLEIIDLR